MAVQAEDIGANFSSYTGNSNLGGGVDIGVLNIDTKPIEDLGKYTMIYNKEERVQKQKAAEAQARKLADLTAYDLTTAIPKDREIIRKEFADLYSYAQNNPTVLDYQNNPDGYLEFGKKKQAFEDKLRGAKTRSILYKVRQNEISASTAPELKALMESNLEKEVKDTDIDTPLRVTEQFDLTVPAIPTPQRRVFDVNIIGDNENAKREFSVVDMKDVNGKASQIALGLNSAVLDQKSPEFLSKTPEEQQLLIEQYRTQKAGGKLITIDQASQYNNALNGYRTPEGELDVVTIASKNPTLAGVMKSFDQYNQYVNAVRDQIKAGAYKDKTGEVLQFGNGTIDERDYAPISYTDGITPEELLKVQILAKAVPDSFKTTVQETDNLQQSKQLVETIRHNKAMENIDRAQLEQKKKEWQSQWDASENQANGAWQFAKDNIMGRLQQIAGADGVITNAELANLDSELLKYLGSDRPAVAEVRDKDNNIIVSARPAGFYPLEISPNSAIGITNDQVLIYDDFKTDKNGKLIVNKNPEKSTTLSNIATNRLKEEVKASTGKELNAFMGVDVKKGNTSNTDTKTKTSSGSSGSNKGMIKMMLPDGTVGEIPVSEEANFLKTYPKAKKI